MDRYGQNFPIDTGFATLQSNSLFLNVLTLSKIFCNMNACFTEGDQILLDHSGCYFFKMLCVREIHGSWFNGNGRFQLNLPRPKGGGNHTLLDFLQRGQGKHSVLIV